MIGAIGSALAFYGAGRPGLFGIVLRTLKSWFIFTRIICSSLKTVLSWLTTNTSAKIVTSEGRSSSLYSIFNLKRFDLIREGTNETHQLTWCVS